MGGRSQRQIKQPKKYGEGAEGLAPKKYVLRLLEEEDVKRSLLGAEVFLLWPDDGLWYPAEIQQVDVKNKSADVIYTTTDEEENINLEELIKDRSIAFREARGVKYALKANEVLDMAVRPEASRSVLDSAGEPEDSGSDAHDSGLEQEAQSSEEDLDSDDEVVTRSRPRARGHAVEDDEDDAYRAAKKRRVLKAEASGVRPKRQITLSTKAQELLAAERAAQMEAILQGRQSTSEGTAADVTMQSDSLPEDARPAEEVERKAPGHSSKTSHTPTKFYSQSSLGRLKSTGSTSGASDREVRAKVVEQIKAALEKVAQESSAEPSALPDPQAVAAAVEEEQYRLFGSADKDYKAKYRSLIFNLRDAANPDLRRRVLLGDIPPDKLVHYSANELASKQLSQWREEKEKEALKAAVLDTQAAAKFSTAAALASKQSGSGHVVDWRDNTLASASPPRDQHPLREPTPDFAADHAENGRPGGRAGPSQPRAAPSQTADTTAGAHNPLGDGLSHRDSLRSGQSAGPETAAELRGDDPKSTTIGSFNWSSIKADALQEWEKSSAQQGEEDGGEEEYDPEDPLDLSRPQEGGQAADHFAIAPSTGPREQVWHGILGNAASVPLPVVVDYLAGNPAWASGLPARQVDVRGKSKLEEVDKFLRGLKTSRSRTISLGLLRLAEEASDEEKSQLAELAKTYSSGKRCGVVPEKAVEFYILPQCPLASGLLGAVQSEEAALTELPPGSMLLVSVHSKTLQPLPSRASKEAKAKEAKAKEAKPAPQTAPKPTSPATDSRPGPSQTSTPQEAPKPAALPDPRAKAASPLQLPQGIDLSSLGSLAAVLGVSQALNLPPAHLHAGAAPLSAQLAVPQQMATHGPAAQASQPHPAMDPRASPSVQMPPNYPAHAGPSFPPAGAAAAQGQPLPGPPQWPAQPTQLPQRPAGIPPHQQPAYRHPPAMPQPGRHTDQQSTHSGPPQQPGVYQQPQYGHQQPSQPRPITLPAPGPRPITLPPPGPPQWGQNRR